jgi:hypothetical protein
VPTEQRVGLDEEPSELRSGDQSAEAGKERSIRGSQGRAGHLPSQHGNLVTEHDDFDGQIGVIGPLKAENLQGPEEGEIEEREGHGPFSLSRPLRRKSQIKAPGGGFWHAQDPQRRRVRGVAAQSVLVAFQILAGNLRKIDNFLEAMSRTETAQTGGHRPHRRRRTTEPISKWLDPSGSTADGGRAPPDG